MSVQLFQPSRGLMSQDTAVQSPAEIQDSWQCQKPRVPGHGHQRTPAGVNSFSSSTGALPGQPTAQLG